MKPYNEAELQKEINEAIREQNHFWWGCVIGLQYGKISVKRVEEDEELSYCVNTVEEIANAFQPIVRVKYGSPYEGKGWSKTGRLVKWYDRKHNPVNVAYLKVKPEPVVFETGASSFYLNSLILFTDNTGSLIRLRDEIYENHRHETELKPETFVALCDAARLTYLREADDKENWEYRYINAMRYKKCYKDVLEFCKIYANDFENWKIDHREV